MRAESTPASPRRFGARPIASRIRARSLASRLPLHREVEDVSHPSGYRLIALEGRCSEPFRHGHGNMTRDLLRDLAGRDPAAGTVQAPVNSVRTCGPLWPCIRSGVVNLVQPSPLECPPPRGEVGRSCAVTRLERQFVYVHLRVLNIVDHEAANAAENDELLPRRLA